MYKLGIVIGRFQPVTDFHVNEIFRPAIEQSDTLLVILGSAHRARTARDPFGSDMVQGMIEQATREIEFSSFKLCFRGVRDYWYSETKWITEIQKIVNDFIKNEASDEKEVDVTLFGSDGSQYDFLDSFPQWNTCISTRKDDEFDILTNLYEGQNDWANYVRASGTIEEWKLSDEGRRITEEHHYLEKYRAATQTGRYPIVFQTVDNVVVYKGNVLLVQRRSKPGRGLWAMPGGFLEVDETLLQSAVRELQEETRLNVKPEWLVNSKTFDAPQRSLRGRTITKAHLWKIPDYRSVPQVRASSDAARAKWFTIAEVREMADQLFEDHLDIIEEMIRSL